MNITELPPLIRSWQRYDRKRASSHIVDGLRRFASLHYNCARRMTQICVFNPRLVSTHYTPNYAIHGAFLRMVPLTDVYTRVGTLIVATIYLQLRHTRKTTFCSPFSLVSK